MQGHNTIKCTSCVQLYTCTPNIILSIRKQHYVKAMRWSLLNSCSVPYHYQVEGIGRLKMVSCLELQCIVHNVLYFVRVRSASSSLLFGEEGPALCKFDHMIFSTLQSSYNYNKVTRPTTITNCYFISAWIAVTGSSSGRATPIHTRTVKEYDQVVPYVTLLLIVPYRILGVIYKRS